MATHGPSYFHLMGTISQLHNHNQHHCSAHHQPSSISPSPFSSPSAPMDDEETAWRLDVTSISGFAIQSQTPTSAQHEIPVNITLQECDIQVSQTLESHSFPFHLQIFLARRASSPVKQDIVLLVPLNQIVNIAISDHGPNGQSLRFKLVPGQRMMGVMRQSVTSGIPGRMWGVNEDDPYHLHGMLKFREFVVRNAGVEEQQISAMRGWVECLRRHAQTEYSHEIQILKEGSDGVWRILDEDDGDGEDPFAMGGIKQDSPDERVETLDGVTEDSLAIAAIDITDCSMDGGSIEPEKIPQFDDRDDSEPKAAPNTSHDRFGETVEDTPQPTRHDSLVHESPGIQSAYLTPCQSPGNELGVPQNTSSDTSPEVDSTPYNATPPTHAQKYPQSLSPQNNRQQSLRTFHLTGPNAIDCPREPSSSIPPSNPSSPTMKYTSPTDPRNSPTRYRVPGEFQRPPNYRRPSFHRNDNKFRHFMPRFNQPFKPHFPIRHINNIPKPKQQYDSYRPDSNRQVSLDRRIEHFHERPPSNGRKRRKIRNERRD
jgi:hypothetical protein